jgi:lipoyl-dependent peroxiredoxin
MTVNTATAEWQGNLPAGKGSFAIGNTKERYTYSFKSRMEGDKNGTNPEELIAAAHASCFSMALSHQLAQAGFTPNTVKTTANVILEKTDGGFSITKIELNTDADVPGITEATFDELANAAKTGCPVSKALAAVGNITLNATLKKAAA